ncbi:FkbM family methyltransferase [Variovorax paradoxus]|uniref:FkbM family methyltransferase n=1 Tax=Variovorax paradoxus TaxID=34073 RepID=A0AAE4BUW6_VARPD|nr:FkbM family methyltransferase [Variovorax paradoxus]MDP9966493.1 FkbM family methyltransferase [Variovorax paradoxus]MDR6423963.1 FkbM family methyltransferase [Variovorax paradoxus]MDR6452763.1 FkbM family methyltransferase [Variovorax paradoxus]
MELGNLSEFGRSRSSTRWATNPVRRFVWWLIAPYFRGAEGRIAARIDAVDSGIRNKIPEISAEIEKVAVEAEKRASAKVDSLTGGLRKDAFAIANRIAGLEEEAGVLSGNLSTLDRKIKSIAHGVEERISKLEISLQKYEQLGANLPQEKNSNGLIIAKGQAAERLLVRQNDHIGKRIIAGEEWEPHVRKAIEEAARPDGVAIDAGAYIGIHTLTMSRCFSTVHAFEPQLGIFQVLCGNLALNERLNVVTHNGALYDRSIAMRLAPQDHQEIGVPMVDGDIDYNRIENAAALSFEIAAPGDPHVDAIALDDLALENVSLIKIDTQGSDLRVLAGAERTIAKSKPVVLFEWERDLAALHGATLEGFFAFFEKLDYAVEVLHETSPGRQADYIAKPRSS